MWFSTFQDIIYDIPKVLRKSHNFVWRPWDVMVKTGRGRLANDETRPSSFDLRRKRRTLSRLTMEERDGKRIKSESFSYGTGTAARRIIGVGYAQRGIHTWHETFFLYFVFMPTWKIRNSLNHRLYNFANGSCEQFFFFFKGM